MNGYLTSPVTPIVAAVVAIAGFTAIIVKIASDRRKKRAFEEARRVHEKVQRQLIDEMRSKPKPRPRLRRPSPPAGRPSDAPLRSSNTDVDHVGLFIPSLLTDYDPAPSRDDSGTSNSHSSSHDSGSSSSSDSGSSSSSSDSGSSGGGGCD